MGRQEAILSDRGIRKAIKEDLITVKSPELFLDSNELVQPASMDVVISRIEEVIPLIYNQKPSQKIYDMDYYKKELLTFLPHCNHSVEIEQLRGYDGKIFFPLMELRSTLRRLGLVSGYNPLGPAVTFEGAYFWIRNPQNYEIDIEKGTKIGQILWKDKKVIYDEEKFDYFSNNYDLPSGDLVTSDSELEKLFDEEKISISPKHISKDGMILFRASDIITRNAQQKITLYKDKRTKGVELKKTKAKKHKIQPGEFVDIQTIEKVKLSPYVGVHVHYIYNYSWDIGIHDKDFPDEEIDELSVEEMLERALTRTSFGGWIDPGYKGVFSVQRKAHQKELIINEGDVVAVGLVYHFKEGVGEAYGKERGSHYNDAKGFIATQKKEEKKKTRE